MKASFIILMMNGLFFGTLCGFFVNIASEVVALLTVFATVKYLGWGEDLREASPTFDKFMKKVDRRGWQVVLMLPFAKGIPVYYVLSLLRMKQLDVVCLCLPSFALIAVLCSYWGDGAFKLIEAAKDGNDALINEVILPFEIGSIAVLALAILYLVYFMYSRDPEEEEALMKNAEQENEP
eukprot:gnl/MRDRNA2_/MRDRNA2_38116_c0_seq2.p1 gnl/MRDRNA2_/MRDRNA2_38116_c0~~gnl/MRDRNA2_/MRDRNA2_38116_c0_seq2.p1  ORF type:complete len:180 (+),score=33.00 gnl/MRDRNA2_/MRDRNA2_38116_c0_seq2:73-612(+)